ncbi:GH32 C-terminal domain-containing protein [Paenibacillus sp. A3]|uniref:GH32 C-terminal domain-containing protein n=1 Tax=Paenibacillus sp. A3 TaxID=1337054 RepID=UPI0006D5578B|nr:GH32 C-terminal domain-containing protein [Paenibacillus sp. A3]
MKFEKGLPILLSCMLLFTSIPMLTAFPSTGRAAGEPSELQTEKEEALISESATKSNSDLSGWRISGKGRLENTEQGIRLASEPKENVLAISDTVADDFIYEADIMLTDMNADATLLFRSNEEGWSSYMLQLVPQAGLLRLKDANGKGTLKVERQVALAAGEIYHMKVKVEGDNIKVYWGDRYQPLIDVKDGAYSSGYLGLHVWDGSALFQNVKVNGMKGNLGTPQHRAGTWRPDLRGYKGTGAAGQQALQIFGLTHDDVMFEGDMSFGRDSADGAMLFRTDKTGHSGYAVSLRKDGNQVRVQLRKADGTVIKTSAQSYLTQPDSRHHVEIHAVGNRIRVFVDGYAEAAVDVTDNSFKSGHVGISAFKGSVYFQNMYVTAAADYYTEQFRPAYHYSPARGSASDPNGLVYYEGEYHLFHQDGGTWAHAVSTDLVNWKRLPIALPWNDYGHVWSGSAVADLENASGLFTESGGKGLIAYYTSHNPDLPGGNQRIGLAYSTDQGRTWKYSKERAIVIENPGKQGDDPGGWDFRDPKVVRDEENGRWVMVVSGGDHIRFFTSTNLLDWTLTDNFGYGNYVRGGVWECPDLFPLTVEGTGEKKWVLMISTGANPKTQGSDAEYFVGELTTEGKFINDNPAGRVLRTDYGKEFYASMSFSNLPDHRRIMVAWMTNWDYPFAFPTVGWKGEITLPREVTLRRTGEGIRLAQAPIEELKSLRSELYTAVHKEVNPNGANLLQGIASGAYEIEAEIEIPLGSGVREFGFHLREGNDQRTIVGYQVAEKQMFVDRSNSGASDFSHLFSTVHTAPLQPEGRRVKLHVFVDESSVEVFGNDGRVVFTDVIFPDPSSRGMSFYTDGGKVNVLSMKVYALKNVWNQTADGTTRMLADTSIREMNVGDSQILNVAVENGKRNGTQPIKWKTSDSNIVRIEQADHAKAVIRATGKGEAAITITTLNGKAAATVPVKVYDGKLLTNLTGWTSDPASLKWIATERGIRGSYPSDAHYMAQETAGNFVYEAEMMLAESGGAGSLLFRASRDGSSGYYFNLDPNMKAFRLFYKIDGGFADRQVLAKVPAFVQPGKTYSVKIEADGPYIQIFVDGTRIMDLKDGTFADGHFGLHVFGGQAYYQNVKASSMQAAKLKKARFTNIATNGFLYTSKSENGEPATLKVAGEGEAAQTWVLVPTGDEHGSYSIRTLEGKALDLDTGQNKIQLYSYLGFNNQRWLLHRNEDGTVSISSVHNGKVFEVSENGNGLSLSEPDPVLDRQKWRMEVVE